MNVVFANTNGTVDVPLNVHGVSFPLDGGTISWTLLDSQMNPVAGLVDQTASAPVGALVASIDIPDSGNTKVGDVESRFLRVSWCGRGAVRQTHLGYLIIDWAPVSTTVDDVRRLLGASRAEVPDSDLNIWQAWLELRSELGSATALTRLTSPDDAGRRMNEAIACRAAANMVQHMMLRLASRMSSETVTFQRFANIDLNEISRNLTVMEKRLLVPREEAALLDSASAPSTFFQLSTAPPDAVTGG